MLDSRTIKESSFDLLVAQNTIGDTTDDAKTRTFKDLFGNPQRSRPRPLDKKKVAGLLS